MLQEDQSGLLTQLKYGPYSPSRLSTAVCGYAFHKQYIQPAPMGTYKEESLPAARGSVFHEVAEQITAAWVENPSATFTKEQVRAMIATSVNNHPPAFEAIAEITDLIEIYLRRPPPLLTSDAAVEQKLAVMFNGKEFVECDYDDPRAVARGRADIMFISDCTTYATVYDHKTQPNIEEADTYQMGIYAWVISKIHPYLVDVKTIIHFARYGRYSDEVIWTWDRDKVGENVCYLEDIEDRLLTEIYTIESREDWAQATPHKGCQYCPYISGCPALAQYIEVSDDGSYRAKAGNPEVILDTGSAVKTAGLVHIMDELVGKLKSGLKAFVTRAGCGVALRGVTYEFRSSGEKINWDKVNKDREKYFAIFDKYGVDPKAFMSFNQTASSKAFFSTDNEPFLKELSEAMPKKEETTFRGYKS